MPVNDIPFSQNVITLFACCFSATHPNAYRTSLNEECIQAGAKTSIGFSHAIYSDTALCYSCEIFFMLLNGEGTVGSIVAKIPFANLFDKNDNKNGAYVEVLGDRQNNLFGRLHYIIDNNGDIIDYSNITSIKDNAMILYKNLVA